MSIEQKRRHRDFLFDPKDRCNRTARRPKSSAARSRERGAALAAVLVMIALLLPLGALAVLEARAGLLTEQSLRGDTEALQAADSGIVCVLAQLDPSADFSTLLLGPDGKSGTADDGQLPFSLTCASPLRFDAHLESGGSGVLVVVSTGYGMRGASRTVEQRLCRISPNEFVRGGWRER